MTMSVTKAERTSGVRADELSSLGAVFAAIMRFGSPRILLASVTAVGAIRVAVGGFGWFDLLLVASTVALAGPFEWVIHRFILHAPDDSLRMTKFGTGNGHRRHHEDPHDVGWALLFWADVLVFLVGLAAFTAGWVIPFALVVGVPVLPAFVTGYLCAVIGLAHYEWTHLLVHTRYRPKTRYYKRLAKNHRLHHYRNEHYWLGVTSNLGDRMLHTLPAAKEDVPLSDTARNLDG